MIDIEKLAGKLINYIVMFVLLSVLGILMSLVGLAVPEAGFLALVSALLIRKE